MPCHLYIWVFSLSLCLSLSLWKCLICFSNVLCWVAYDVSCHLIFCQCRITCTLYRVILSVLDPRKCEYLKDYSLDFEHAYMTTYLWDIRIFLGLVQKESHCISRHTWPLADWASWGYALNDWGLTPTFPRLTWESLLLWRDLPPGMMLQVGEAVRFSPPIAEFKIWLCVPPTPQYIIMSWPFIKHKWNLFVPKEWLIVEWCT